MPEFEYQVRPEPDAAVTLPLPEQLRALVGRGSLSLRLHLAEWQSHHYALFIIVVVGICLLGHFLGRMRQAMTRKKRVAKRK
jgi:hypothetical protein